MNFTNQLAPQPPGWAGLPSDLFQEIADRLTTYEDLLSLKSVCHWWRFHCSQVNWTTNPQLPWLMLSEKQDGTARSFYSFDKNKHYEIELQPARGRRCFASPYGWIATLSRDGKIDLLNPLSKHGKNLPRLSPSNEMPTARDWFYFIHKLVVFKRFSNDFIVMAIYGSKNRLAFVRYGDNEWKTVREVSNVRDVVLFEGEFYALLSTGTLMRIKFSGPNVARAIFIALGPKYLNIRECVEVYLVKSSLGDLLGVSRHGIVFAGGRETTYFMVYKFDMSKRKWKRLKDLGECAIFVGEGNSWSISASNSIRARNNMIYYADDYWRRPRESAFSGLDIPFFSARDMIRIDAGGLTHSDVEVTSSDSGEGTDSDEGKGKAIDRGKGKDIDAGKVTDSDEEEEVRVSDEEDEEVIYGHDIGVFSMASGKMELSRELLNFGEDIPCEYSRPIWFMPKLHSKFFSY